MDSKIVTHHVYDLMLIIIVIRYQVLIVCNKVVIVVTTTIVNKQHLNLAFCKSLTFADLYFKFLLADFFNRNEPQANSKIDGNIIIPHVVRSFLIRLDLHVNFQIIILTVKVYDTH